MILHANKLKTIVSETTTGRGTTSTDVLMETSVVALALYVTSCAPDCVVLVDVYEVGVNTSDDVLIGKFPLVKGAKTDPIHLTLQSTGNIRIDVAYNAAVTYEIRGKSLTSKPLPDTLTVTGAQPEQEFRTYVEEMLWAMNSNLEKILNHHRAITGLEKDKGEKF